MAGNKQAELPRTTTFGPEARIPTDEPTEAEPDDIQQRVCKEPLAGPAKPQSFNITPTPTSLTTPVSDTRNQLATSQHPIPPASKLPHTSTIGLGLGLGLRGSRLAPFGLRAALGDVQARRLSLPPQQQQVLPDREEEAIEELPVAQSEASSSTGVREVDGGGGGGDEEDDGRSALPRMMMLIAGAVAVGTIMQRVGE